MSATPDAIVALVLAIVNLVQVAILAYLKIDTAELKEEVRCVRDRRARDRGDS